MNISAKYRTIQLVLRHRDPRPIEYELSGVSVQNHRGKRKEKASCTYCILRSRHFAASIQSTLSYVRTLPMNYYLYHATVTHTRYVDTICYSKSVCGMLQRAFMFRRALTRWPTAWRNPSDFFLKRRKMSDMTESNYWDEFLTNTTSRWLFNEERRMSW